jgi:hypothetical protein
VLLVVEGGGEGAWRQSAKGNGGGGGELEGEGHRSGHAASKRRIYPAEQARCGMPMRVNIDAVIMCSSGCVKCP